MKISSIMCCNDITDNTFGQATLSAPLQIFNLVNIPSSFSFSLSVGILDINEGDTISITIKDQNNEIVNDLQNISFPEFPEAVDKNSPIGMQLNLNIKNMIFKIEGLYSIEVLDMNKSVLVKSYFRVLKQGVL